jgi:hypothetical protein
MPYERFLMLLKSRSRTYHPYMHYSYTGVGAKTCLPSRSTQKCFLPHWKWTPKIFPIGYSTNKCSKFFLIYLKKFCCRKGTWGYTKVIHKKRKKSWEKMDKFPRYLKQWVLRCPPEKKKAINKITLALLQMFPSFKREICF